MTIIIFILVLAVLIFVHELGHFLAARMFGIRVDAFKIGFGPKLLAWRLGETEYGVNLIPFGGFVRIFGENPDQESLAGPDASRSFVNKPRWQQAIVLVAGIVFNFAFAWLLYTIIFSAGVTVDSELFSGYKDKLTDERIILSYVAPGSPAAQSGLKDGDTIVYVETTAMNGARLGGAQNDPARAAVAKPAQTIEEIKQTIDQYGGKPVAIEYVRNGSHNIVGVTPIPGLVPDKNAIGIGMNYAAHLQLPIGSAIIEGLRFTGLLIRETVTGVYGLVAGIFHGTADFSDVSGPVGIYGIVGDAARMGWTYLLMITAIISVNLGVINLIPFPALDGGRILFVGIEAVTRRRIPHKFVNAVNLVGFGLLMILMIAITWRDVAKLITK